MYRTDLVLFQVCSIWKIVTVGFTGGLNKLRDRFYLFIPRFIPKAADIVRGVWCVCVYEKDLNV